jgi:hypothetical protein
MTRLAIIMVTLLVGLSACHAHGGFGFGDNGQHSTYVATNAFGSAAAQASIGTVSPTGD